MKAILFEVKSRAGDECLFQAGLSIKNALESAGATVSMDTGTDPKLRHYIGKHGSMRPPTNSGKANDLLGLDVEVVISTAFKEPEASQNDKFKAFLQQHFAEQHPDENLLNQGFKSYVFMREYNEAPDDVSDRDFLYAGKIEQGDKDSELADMLQGFVTKSGERLHCFGYREGDSGRGRDHTFWAQLQDNSSIVLILSHR
jgi:hypothetical protein